MKDKDYQTYATYKISEIPISILKHVINVFVDYAALNLGTSADKENVDRIIEYIQMNEFNSLPLSVIASAFMRGSLGKLKNDNTKLTPRNIYEWICEVSVEYGQKMEHQNRLRQKSEKTFDLNKYPVGMAMLWKIDLINSGAINDDDWDQIDPKIVADMIARGEHPTLADFGIKNRRNEI